MCVLIAVVVTSLGARVLLPRSVAAADPAPSPTLASCTDLYPEDGPAGLDLRFGCVVQRIVTGYTGVRASDAPARITVWLPAIGGSVLLLVAVLLALRWAWRRVSRRLAPVTPVAWWACSSCHSVNGAGTVACYACGTPAAADDMVMPTADRPEMPQAFGGTRKSGR